VIPNRYLSRPENVLRKCYRYYHSTLCFVRELNITHQEYDGALNFATDAWTSPNHRAYVAVTVHFECKGVPISMLLDLVEVAKSHSGVNLAEAFAKVLEEFGIKDKVSFR
jgi:hypothetical protein